MHHAHCSAQWVTSHIGTRSDQIGLSLTNARQGGGFLNSPSRFFISDKLLELSTRNLQQFSGHQLYTLCANKISYLPKGSPRMTSESTYLTAISDVLNFEKQRKYLPNFRKKNFFNRFFVKTGTHVIEPIKVNQY